MAIVKEKVTQYHNNQKVGSYTQVNIPASVISTANSAIDSVFDMNKQAIESKIEKMTEIYDRIDDNLNFLSNFKDLDDDFEKSFNNATFKFNNIKNNYISKSNDGKYKLKTGAKHGMYSFALIVVGIIFSLTLGDAGAVLVIAGFGYSFLSYFVLTHMELKKAVNAMEGLVDTIKKGKFFQMSNEIISVLNYYKSDEVKGKLYSQEISQEEYENDLINALKKAIDLNLDRNNIIEVVAADFGKEAEMTEKAILQEAENKRKREDRKSQIEAKQLETAKKHGFQTWDEYLDWERKVESRKSNKLNKSLFNFIKLCLNAVFISIILFVILGIIETNFIENPITIAQYIESFIKNVGPSSLFLFIIGLLLAKFISWWKTL